MSLNNYSTKKKYFCRLSSDVIYVLPLTKNKVGSYLNTSNPHPPSFIDQKPLTNTTPPFLHPPPIHLPLPDPSTSPPHPLPPQNPLQKLPLP